METKPSVSAFEIEELPDANDTINRDILGMLRSKPVKEEPDK